MLEYDNAQLRQIVADSTPDNRILRDVNQKSGEAVGAPSPRHQQPGRYLKREIPGHVRSYNFIFERMKDGKPLKFLTIVDESRLPYRYRAAFSDWTSRHQDAGDVAPRLGSTGLPAQ